MNIRKSKEIIHHHQSIPPKGRSSNIKSGTQAAVFLGMVSCVSFPLLSALFQLLTIKQFNFYYVMDNISEHNIRPLTRRPLKVLKSCFCKRFRFVWISIGCNLNQQIFICKSKNRCFVVYYKI